MRIFGDDFILLGTNFDVYFMNFGFFGFKMDFGGILDFCQKLQF